MNFISTLSLWQWALLAAVPPAIVALYFLKLKRQPLEVPSTYLWHKSIEDLHVNSLWQRIRQNLLLYLQLLIVALVILALWRPGWQGGAKLDNRNIFLIDNSASMNATDVKPTRLQEAKQQTLKMIDEMASSDQGMVVSFSDIARVDQGWTNSRRELRRAVENIKPTNRPTAINEALQVAAGLANPGKSEYADNRSVESRPAKLFILSDGKFPPVPGFSLGNLDPVFMPIGEASPENLGIIAFSVRRNDDREGQLQAFGSVQNFGEEAADTTLELWMDGKQIDASNLKVPPGETSGASFNLPELDSGILELRLTKQDALPEDNRAWTAVNSSRKPKVLLVTNGNEALEFALATPRAGELADVSKALPSVLETKEHQRAAASGAYDLIIYDRCSPTVSPRANTLYIGTIPPSPNADPAFADKAKPDDAGKSKPDEAAKTKSDEAAKAKPDDAAKSTAEATPGVAPPPAKWWSLGESVVYPQIIDLDRTHPLMQWLDLGDVDIAGAKAVTPPPGGTKLLDSNKGTLFAIAPREGFEDAVLGFEIYSTDANGERTPNTNWPIRRSFPAFVFAALGYLGGNDGAQAGESVKPGQPLMLKSEAAADSITVLTPQGARLPVTRSKSGSFQFSETQELGAYEVREGPKAIERFTVNLFDPMESNIVPAKEKTIQIGNVSVEGKEGYQTVRRETWKWLLIVALVVLIAEWYIYNRRVYV
jgi:hypothetical protein